jgi:hypothetical protein
VTRDQLPRHGECRNNVAAGASAGDENPKCQSVPLSQFRRFGVSQIREAVRSREPDLSTSPMKRHKKARLPKQTGSSI